MNDQGGSCEPGNTVEEAKQPESFHKRLLDQVQEAVIATDLAGRIVYWNRFAETLYGWSAEEAIGRLLVELTPSLDAQRDAKSIMNVLREGGTWSGEIVLKRRDGTTSFASCITA
jgi:PAS domain S-box-containing protein